ncbi:MAG TPA: nicotinate (nicotinamide) nucleotide adenylyltransferase [Tepidisphaeraceae bacterium]|jgi:nicotinate-nucleotide adenylyltransferase
MKTLCLGGSFNPIHHGHLICSRAAAEAGGYERVLLIPSAQPPHKPDRSELADASHRLQMCRLAIKIPSRDTLPVGPKASQITFDVSEVELPRTGPSYTLDTVRQLRSEGWPEVHWLIGADMLNYLPKWHRAADLLRETHFVVMARPEVPIAWESLPAEFGKLKSHVVTTPLVQISSTNIRQRIRAGLPIDYLAPPPVADYIHNHKLYL